MTGLVPAHFLMSPGASLRGRSLLFRTIIALLPAYLRISRSSSSPAGRDASSTMIRPSASRAIFCPWRRRASRRDGGSAEAGHIDEMKDDAGDAHLFLRKSLVVPGKGVTMARSSSRSALNQGRFADVRPATMAKVTPSARARPVS